MLDIFYDFCAVNIIFPIFIPFSDYLIRTTVPFLKCGNEWLYQYRKGTTGKSRGLWFAAKCSILVKSLNDRPQKTQAGEADHLDQF